MNDTNHNDDHVALDETGQTIQSIIQTIRTALPGLPSASPPDSNDEGPYNYSRTGKIARLPASTRESVNLMLHDNVPYAAIIEKLAALGHPAISPSNITHWKEGGYLEWIYRRHQAESLTAAIKANSQLLEELTPREQEALHNILELTFAHHMLTAFSKFNAAALHTDTAAKVLSLFSASMSRHFRERTRHQRLLLAIRKYEDSGADPKKVPPTASTTRNPPQITSNE